MSELSNAGATAGNTHRWLWFPAFAGTTPNLFIAFSKTKKRRGGHPAPALYFSLAQNLRRVEAGHRFHLEIFLQAVFAPLAAVAGLLVAAERRGAVVRHALQVDVAGPDLAADFSRTLNGTRGNIAGETIGRVVGNLDGLRLVLGAKDGQHRSKDFLARDRHVVGDVGEDGRADIKALVDAFRQARAAGDQRCAFLDALVDQCLDLVPLDAGHDGADGGALRARIA